MIICVCCVREWSYSLFERKYHSGTLVKDCPRIIRVHFRDEIINNVADIASSADERVQRMSVSLGRTNVVADSFDK